MKKISLKSVKEYLSRDEMRTINGGSGINGCDGGIICSTDASCTTGNCTCQHAHGSNRCWPKA